MTNYYRAYCDDHDWEGMPREKESEALLDLAGHKGLFSDEAHTNSGVRHAAQNLTRRRSRSARLESDSIIFENGDRNVRLMKTTNVTFQGRRSNCELLFPELVSSSGNRIWYEASRVLSHAGQTLVIPPGKWKINFTVSYADSNRARCFLVVAWDDGPSSKMKVVQASASD